MQTSPTRSPRILSLALTLASCATRGGELPSSPAGITPESITVTSRSFSSGAPLPIDCTCDGSDTSPDVTWSSPPEGTKALVVTLDDQEPTNGVVTRWIVIDVKPDARSLHAGADPASVGGRVLRNDMGRVSYRGPCPPHREGHHYALRVVALDHPLDLPESTDREAANGAMNGHVLGSGQIVGTTQR